MIKFEVLKDHSEHSVRSRLEMSRNVWEGSGSEPPQETWGETLGVLTRAKVRGTERSSPPKRKWENEQTESAREFEVELRRRAALVL